jgi:hypothetical protein
MKMVNKTVKEFSTVKFWIDPDGNIQMNGCMQYIEFVAKLTYVLANMIPGFKMICRTYPVTIKFTSIDKRLKSIEIDF